MRASTITSTVAVAVASLAGRSLAAAALIPREDATVGGYTDTNCVQTLDTPEGKPTNGGTCYTYDNAGSYSFADNSGACSLTRWSGPDCTGTSVVAYAAGTQWNECDALTFKSLEVRCGSNI